MDAESGGGAEPRKNIHGFCGGPDVILHVILPIKVIRLSSKGIVASIQLHKGTLALYSTSIQDRWMLIVIVFETSKAGLCSNMDMVIWPSNNSPKKV
jgi:hypothetical protein